MKFLFVIKGIAGPSGGAERVFAAVANALAGRGHEIVVVTFDSTVDAPFYDIDESIAIHRLGTTDARDSISRLALPRIVARLRRLAKEVRPNAAVAFMHSAFVPSALALVGTGIPLIASEHIDAAHYRTRPIQRWAKKFAVARSVAKTVPSTNVRDQHIGRARDKVVVIANPVDLPRLNTTLQADCAPLILSAGRFMDQKDFPTLIGAFALLAPQFPEWRLRIVGDGVLRDRLEAQVRDLSLEDRVEMPGTVRDMAGEYARAAIFVLPSLYESFGLVVAEAMAAGRPAVAFSNCLGPAELVQDGVSGILVDPCGGRESALANALRRLMTDAELRERIGASAQGTIARFGLGPVADRWERLCEAAARGERIRAEEWS